MNSAIFYLMALVVLVAGLGTAVARRSRPAAIWLLGALVALSALLVALHQGLIALCLLGALGLVGGAALHLANLRMPEAAPPEPVNERERYWSGLLAILLFVVILRVVSASDWGLRTLELASPAAGGLTILLAGLGGPEVALLAVMAALGLLAVLLGWREVRS